jgi:uncharacterized low-complexity protein
MNSKISKPLVGAIGVALLGMAGAAQSSATFSLVDLGTGYMLSAGGEGKCGEGKCGEGKCGMNMADANKDGKVTRAEHDAHAAAMFTAVDTNKDGTIDQAERDAHHKAKHDGHHGKEGSCGGDKGGKEGSCGGDKGGKEGSCGGSR